MPASCASGLTGISIPIIFEISDALLPAALIKIEQLYLALSVIIFFTFLA